MKSSSDKQMNRREAFKNVFNTFKNEAKEADSEQERIEPKTELTSLESLDEWEDLLEDE